MADTFAVYDSNSGKIPFSHRQPVGTTEMLTQC